MQTALGYLRWTRAEFQGGVLIRKAKYNGFGAVKVEFAWKSAGILQGTMVTQAFTTPIRFFPERSLAVSPGSLRAQWGN
jgi:hypothetical protein